MSSPSKNKGSGFEREIAKFLSELYGESFIRAPGSGAYTGGNNSHRKTVLHEGQARSFKGDIVPGQSFPKFNAEAKFYADFPFHQVLTNCVILEKWLQQLMDASDEGDMNILFMKFNRKGRYVCVEKDLQWSTDCNMIRYYSDKTKKEWLIFDFDVFFEKNTELLKEYSAIK